MFNFRILIFGILLLLTSCSLYKIETISGDSVKTFSPENVLMELIENKEPFVFKNRFYVSFDSDIITIAKDGSMLEFHTSEDAINYLLNK